MKDKIIQVWQCTDETIFSSEEEAKDHQKELNHFDSRMGALNAALEKAGIFILGNTELESMVNFRKEITSALNLGEQT